MLRNLFFFVTLSITVGIASCVPPEMNNAKFNSINIDFNDKQIQTILNLEERQSTDSLLPFLKNQNPTYRYLAAMAFAGLKDGKGTDTLIKLLPAGSVLVFNTFVLFTIAVLLITQL